MTLHARGYLPFDLVRRFDEDPLCEGGTAACHNGILASICDTDYGAAFGAMAGRIRDRMSGR